MKCGIIFCVVICCADFSKCIHEYKNDCGTITVAQPAIHGKFVLLTFIPNGPVHDQTKVAWKYRSDYVVAWRETDISNSPRHIVSSRNATYTMDLYCDKDKVDFSKTEFSATRITSSGECTSVWIEIYVREAPALCGILYSETKQIKPNDEVVLKYYAPPVVLSDKQYIRQVRLKHDYCREYLGCPVNQTWYTKEYRERNSVYVYTIRNFTPDMGGRYLIQCTNRSSNNRATNTVRLIIPVPPSTPTFLNTSDVDGCLDCIPVNYNTYADIECQVLGGGTLPVTVKIVIAGEEVAKCNLDKPSRTTCKLSKYIDSSLHLNEIRCNASNEAISDPLSTSTKLYVVEKPWSPSLVNRQQTEGKVNIYCYSKNGRPAPELTMLIDGNPINITNVQKKDPDKNIKLTYLERDWNGAKIACCMHHLYFTEPICSERTVDYLFSPASVHLAVSKLEPSGRGSFLQTLRCTIINANPACFVKWNHSDEADVTIGTEEITRPAGQGGYTTVSELLLNGTMEIDGSKIDCQPICDKFETKDKATLTIRIPSKDKPIAETREETLPWTYIGIGAAAAGVVVLIILTILVLKRRSNMDRRETGHEDIPKNTPNGQPIVNEPRDEQNGTDAYEVIIEYENVPRNASSGQAIVNEPRDEQIGSNAYEAIIGTYFDNYFDPGVRERKKCTVHSNVH